ncbi:N-acyl homoserine lactonase family protein [Roseomonas eburnea]|uniref:N-acyl homoserine lactonase family protein n=1 Tax=Neoroseomonas eburnea TaxID=1346889 RepID=A0A9X9XB69_9PROT|nr:N-acyl homoserine lactonase family protein [Neoroseomonas eburnea]MBR0680955.1 N-acyl homoserine lactonase family protein [Neoroseomonas eburnea]
MKLHLLSGGRIRLRRATYIPGAPREATFDAPVPCFLVRHPKGDVLIDTGCNPAAAADPAGVWGGLAKAMPPLHGPGEHVGTSLAALGVRPEAVTVVVMTHLHFDHAGANAMFPNANFVVQGAELAAASAPDAEAWGYLRSEWDTGRPMRVIDGEADLFGDGAIRLIPLPGHTPGLMGVLLDLPRDGRVLIAGDAVPLREVLDEDLMPRNMRDAEAARASYARVRAIEAEGVLVICGHDMAQWQSLRHDADGYA